MKRLACEMCGGTDLIKQDGVFVCQNCGMKYSAEDAKKMMIEGSVKIDNSDRIKNYLELARAAKSEDDSMTAAKYYALLLEEIPNSWEAKFYSTYYAAMECKVNEIYQMCVKMEKLANPVLTTIKTNEPESLHAKFVLEIAEKMNKLSLMFAKEDSDSVEEVPDMLILWGNQLEEKFSDIFDITSTAADFWELALSLIIETYGTGEKAIDDKISQYSEKIKKYHPTYVPPKSKLTYHTSDSPNKLSVAVVKVGHETCESLPNVGLTEVFKQGPDEYGNIGTEIKIKNIAGRTIKYITVYLTPFNSVGDAVSCSVYGYSTYGIEITGPILVGNQWAGYCDDMWDNNTIVSAEVDHVDVTYEDDSVERYTASELTYEDASSIERNTISELTCEDASMEQHTAPELTDKNTSNSSNSSNSGGCYVATAVYGSYDCPQVWTLRRYRDNTLAETWYGRLFIKTYYAISPTLVKWFGHTEWFKEMWKGKLDRIVASLKDDGVEDTSYEDRKW